MSSLFLEDLRRKYGLAALIYFAAVILIRIIGGKTLSNFCGQPIFAPEYSYIYWALLSTGWPAAIISSPFLCFLTDALTLLLPFVAIFSHKRRELWVGAALIVFFIQTVTVEVYSVSHSKSVVALYLVLLPLLLPERKFLLMADFARYGGLSIILQAVYWKFVNGGLLVKGNYLIQLINQYTDRAILNPDHYLYQISLFIIARPALSDLLYKMLFLTQAIFILSFFTRRFDKVLILFLFAFSLTTWLFMGIYNFDIFIVSVPLWFSGAIGVLLKAESLTARLR